MAIAEAVAKKELIFIPANETQSLKIRVAGYARVSSDSTDQLNSFSAQIRYYTNLINEKENYEMVDVYADEGISGVSLDNRDEFNRMIEDARNGQIDLIITKSLSRFARNTVDCLTTLRELKSLGVAVQFEKEGMDTSKISSENLLTIYSLLAQQESESISQNCKKAVRKRMSTGEYIQSSVPYGYRLGNKKLEIYEPEAEIVRRIFKEYLSGYGKMSIAKGLNADYIPKKNGEIKWRINTIHSILNNERYIGDMLLQKTFNEDVIPYNKRINQGELEKYYVSNTHDAIIDRISFEVVKIILQENKTAHSNKAESGEYLLNQKVICKCCGTKYRRKVRNNIANWVCKKKDINYEGCESVSYTEEQIYIAFINLYNKLKSNYKEVLLPLLNQLEKLEDIKNKDNIEVKELNKKISELTEQNHMLTGLMSSGVLDSALFISKTDESNREIQKLKKRKSQILQNRKKNSLVDNTELLIDIIEENEEYLTEMNEEIFEDMIEKIVANDDNTITFILVNGLELTERISND